ncbi:MAG: sialidase family protein [Kofleriaceae bacterium]|nr:sialidase family protein [Kofleriaceae bacterium]
MRRSFSRALLGVVAMGALAHSNGRPPATNGVYVRSTDPHSLYVRTTFGLLISHDDGCSFRWVCEKAIGYGGEFDPKYAIAADGTIFATTFTGLRVSRDGGCSWETATATKPAGDPGRIADMWIDGIAIAPNGDIWVVTADSGKPNNVYHSTDNGLTFTPGPLASAQIWWKSVAIARSQPQRIYVTGYQVAPAVQASLRVSDDGGTTWAPRPFAPTVKLGTTPVVVATAVDPLNPDHLFLTSIGAHPPEGDVLYRSTDGGQTLTEVVTTRDPVRGVVFRKDGKVVIATLASGTWELATDGTLTALGEVQPNAPDIAPPRFGCLAEQVNGTLVGCGANWQPDYMAVGAGASPVGMKKLFRFVELAGPLTCPVGTTTHEVCDPQWPALQQQFGATGPSATCAGVIAPPPMPPDATPAKKDVGGCCDAGGAPRGELALAALVALVGLRRRYKSPSRQLG